MVKVNRRELNWQSRKTRAALAAAVCVAGLVAGLGSCISAGTVGDLRAAVGTETKVPSTQCQDTKQKCTGAVPAGTVTGPCTLDDENADKHCAFDITGPTDNYSCSGMYPGKDCYTTNSVDCITYKPGMCMPSQFGGAVCQQQGFYPIGTVLTNGTASRCTN